MAIKRRYWDWPQVAGLALVLSATLAALIFVDPAKLEGWISVAPGLIGVATTLYSMSRGRAVATATIEGK
jgi:hypothetical protein